MLRVPLESHSEHTLASEVWCSAVGCTLQAHHTIVIVSLTFVHYHLLLPQQCTPTAAMKTSSGSENQQQQVLV